MIYWIFILQVPAINDITGIINTGTYVQHRPILAIIMIQKQDSIKSFLENGNVCWAVNANTDSLSSIPKYRSTDNPISQVCTQVPKTDNSNNTDHL